MGCFASKPKSPNGDKIDVDVKDAPSPTKKRETSTSLGTKSTSEGKGEPITDAKNVVITHSTFIGEKDGKVTTEYNLLSPPVGKGAFGEVRRAVHKKSNITRAIKIIYKENTDKEEQERLINEVNILKTLDHPNIMKVLEFYQDENHFYIVSEFYNGGELFDKIMSLKSFSEKQAALTMKQILSAVFYCHQHNIVHRDLKPENILYESKKEDALLKIIDFGTSKQFEANSKMNQKFGTAYYIAPEVLKRKYNEKCDIWSCGVILYILLCGYPPFNGADDKAIMEKVGLGKYDFHHEEWKGVTPEAKKFIEKMMEIDVTKRYSAEQALQDPWIKKMCGATEIDRPLAVSALKNLKSFRAEKKLQEATWVFLVTYMSTREEKAELLKTFQALDLNGDGQLTREELIEGYKKFMSSEEAEKEVDTILKAVDANGSGALDYSEFVMATINRQKLLSKERLEATFKMFDKDGSGYLEIEEIKAIFNPNGTQVIADSVWLDLIKEVDPNSDGKISLSEFKEMMMKLV